MMPYHHNIKCAECGKLAPHKAHNLCVHCYARQYSHVYFLDETNRERYRAWRLAYELREIQKEFTSHPQTNHTA